MADYSNWFALAVHLANKFLRATLNPQCVCIQSSSWQKNSIELPGVDVTKQCIYSEFIGFVEVLKRLNTSFFWGDQNRFRASFVQGFTWLSQLGIFHSVGCQDRHAQSIERCILRHSLLHALVSRKT